MTRYYRLVLAIVSLTLAVEANAQSTSSVSSYSRYGLGTLNDQSQGFNKAMGGVGIGLRAGNRVNMANPASYSAIDSLSFIFDVNMSASMGNYKQRATNINVRNCTLENVNAGFRLRKDMGMSFGFVPYTSIGYSFTSGSTIASENISMQIIKTVTEYSGEGGLHQAYIGLGARVFKNLSLGANFSFLWGDYRHSVIQSFYEGVNVSSTYSGLNSIHEAQLRTYKVDLGAQYPIRLTPKDWLTLGATAGIGHKVSGNATLKRYTDTDTDPTPVSISSAFDIPHSFGVGLGWQHESKILVGVDYKQERWSGCRAPEYRNGTYTANKGAYTDRHSFAAGAQYLPNRFSSSYMNRVQYRVGANYSTSYLVINGKDGPREYGVSAGVGLPITNNINNRSIVNIGLQWMRRAPATTAMITENYFMVTAGITFNESWFMKFKIK